MVGEDYLVEPNTVVIEIRAVKDEGQCFYIIIKGDNRLEDDERVTFSLNTRDNSVIDESTNTLVLTIINDDCKIFLLRFKNNWLDIRM